MIYNFRISQKIITLLVLVFASCKSADFKVNKASANSEIREIVQQIQKINTREIVLNQMIVQRVAVFAPENTALIDTVFRYNNKFKIQNNTILDKNLTKRKLRAYFEKQEELSAIVNLLFERIFTLKKNHSNRDLSDLSYAILNNHTRRLLLLKKYNQLVNNYANYINYPKYANTKTTK